MRNQNRVLMLLENGPYPRDSRVRAEANALTDAGYEVTVICPTWDKEPMAENVKGVQVYRYPALPEMEGLLGFIAEYSYALNVTFLITLFVWFRRGFDVIHSHNPPDLFVFIALFFKPFGKKFVFDHHDLSPEVYQARTPTGGNKVLYQILIGLEKLSLRVADLVIATNESYKRLEMERGRVPEEQVTIVRNAPDLNRLKLTTPSPSLREKAGTILCYVGEMGYQDGLDYLMRALHHLRHDLNESDFYCVLMGKGPELDNLKQLAKELDIEENVWFFGWANGQQLSEVLSTSDICVDPDPSNPFNDRSTMIKMAEYMAFAKPIVAFDLPEHRFTAEDAALYVPDNNELEFAKAVKLLMGNPELRKTMGESGKQRVISQLSWQHSARNLTQGYASILPLRSQKKSRSTEPTTVLKKIDA